MHCLALRDMKLSCLQRLLSMIHLLTWHYDQLSLYGSSTMAGTLLTALHLATARCSSVTIITIARAVLEPPAPALLIESHAAYYEYAVAGFCQVGQRIA